MAGVPALASGSSPVNYETGSNVLPFPGTTYNSTGGGVQKMDELEAHAIENAIAQYKGNLTEAAKAVCDRKRTIGVLAEVLAEQMHKLHGGEWRFDLNHETKYVVIRQCADKADLRINKTELREAV